MNQVINTNNLKTMEDTVNSRILLLKTKSTLENQEFAAKCNIAIGTLWNIQNGENVSTKTIKSISTALNANPDWIKTGKGKMYLEEVQTKVMIDPWRDQAFQSMKDEIAFYRQIISNLTGGKAPVFLRALNGSGFKEKSLRAQAA